jgi:hypothetical protein
MIHQPVSAQPRPAGRSFPRIRRWAIALTVAATALLAGSPAALGVPLPPPDGGGPVIPPPPDTTAALLPLWAVVAIVTATVVLSVATTLVTLSVERMRSARRTPAAAAGPQAEKGDILSSHHYPAR